MQTRVAPKTRREPASRIRSVASASDGGASGGGAGAGARRGGRVQVRVHTARQHQNCQKHDQYPRAHETTITTSTTKRNAWRVEESDLAGRRVSSEVLFRSNLSLLSSSP